MFKNFLKKNRLTILFILISFFTIACKTTSTMERAIPNNEKIEAPFILAHDVVFPDDDEHCRFLFFRFLNPEYKNPLYIANLLKGGIAATNVDNAPEISHASINFTLEDNYYGLTLGGEYQLAPENCQTPDENKYMKNCNPEKSEQITYALKVSEEEYNKTKAFVENYANSKELKYDPSLNFKIAIFSIKRKFFTPQENQKFGCITYPEDSQNKKYNPADENHENNFVCSTFIGYVLYNNIEQVTKYFDENNIKYEYLNVSDISLIPGMTPLFYSNWDNYISAAHAFIQENPEFSDYLTEQN